MSNLRLSWPFLGIAGARDESVGWCALCGPLRRASDLQAYEKLRREFRFVGLASYSTFPLIREGVVQNHERLCEAWGHGFRNPDRYLSEPMPRTLVSESDFVDPELISPTLLSKEARAQGKDLDFIYVCLPGRWAETTKNWGLAKRCLGPLCDGLNLKGMLVGRWQILDLPFRRNLTVVGDIPQGRLLEHLHRARMLLVPSVLDASPRLLAEALSMNVPILVNEAILGGWKYVTETTGAFFTSEDDVARAAIQCLNGALQPRRWFEANHGPAAASRRLSALVGQCDTALQPSGDWRLIRRIKGRGPALAKPIAQRDRGKGQAIG